VKVVPCNPADFESRAQQVRSLSAAPTETIFSERGSFEVSRGSNLVFSAPHAAAHTRNNTTKLPEPGTAQVAVGLASVCGGSALLTTGHQLGDPNWDSGHPYRLTALELSTNGALIDLHGMQEDRADVCIGTGPDHEQSRALWTPLLDELLAADVRVAFNHPFAGRNRTLTAAAQHAHTPALQIEISRTARIPLSTEHICVVSALMRAAVHWAELVRQR
jgi:hypothetical protein